MTSHVFVVLTYFCCLVFCNSNETSNKGQYSKFITSEVVVAQTSEILKDYSLNTLRYYRRLSATPDLRFQTPEEGSYLKFHRCHDEGEVYAAAYLVTKEHIMNHNTQYNLSHANTELASFIVLDTGHPKSGIRSGTMTQSLDILDFSVIHLSAYERLMRRYNMPEMESYSPVANAATVLMKYALDIVTAGRPGLTQQLNATVVIMPWLGSEIGAGNSKLTHRQAFLRACFWSFYAMIPNVVIGVKNAKDDQFAR